MNVRELNRRIKQILKSEVGKWRYFLIALAWLMLMVFFTYTAILKGAMMVENTLEYAHWSNQCNVIALIVNIGLIAMIIFDYRLSSNNMSHTMLWLIFIGIFLAIGIYGHALIHQSDSLSDYRIPLSWSPLSMSLHLAFLLVLLW